MDTQHTNNVDQMDDRDAPQRDAQAAPATTVDVTDQVTDQVTDAPATAEEQAPTPKEARAPRTAAAVVLDRLAALEVGVGTTHERMVVFPLFARNGSQGAHGAAASPLRYRTLEQVLADGSVEVTEQASATVPELVLHNKGATLILVLDGEEIVGGRQNRVVNASFLVEAEATIPLPVTCVESGRWYPTSPSFSSGESTYYSLKREKHAQVHESLRRSHSHSSDQGAVWNSISARAMAAGAASPTGAMHAMYQSRGGSLDEYLRAFPYVAGAVGFAVALSGRMAGGDLFDQPETAQALWPKLLRSYALDAMDTPAGSASASADHDGAVRLIERARAARCETYPSLALGQDVRFEGDGVIGGGLVYQETPIHVTLFSTDDASASQPSAMARASQRRQAYALPPATSPQARRAPGGSAPGGETPETSAPEE
jgi:hypothetical protein